MVDQIRQALIITRREMRDQFRDWRITIPIFVLTLIFPSIMNFTAERLVNFTRQYGGVILAERMIPFLLMIVGFFPVSVSLVIALESFAGEKERGSIEPLLSSPLKDWQLYFGKLMAVMFPPLMAAYLGIAVYILGVYRDLKWFPSWDLLLLMLTLTFVQALLMVSGAVVISTQATTVRAANLLASFIIIPVAFLIQAESVVIFWGNYDTLWWTVVGLTVVSGLLVRTGISYFNREELLGRAIDDLKMSWMWNNFISQFKGRAVSLSSWYRIEIKGLLRDMRLPFSMMVGLIVAAYLVGVSQARVFVIPPELIRVDELNKNIIEGIESISLFSTQGVFLIAWHNIRTLLIATILGFFSYGVAGILIVLIPFAFFGYFSLPIAAAGMPLGKFFLATVAPHGILEIPAILLAGAAIYRIGGRLAAPSGGKSIGEGLMRAFADWAKIMVGVVIPLLVAAAAVEALLTPKIVIWLLGT